MVIGYFLLAMLSSFVFRAVRDALPGNPAAQEHIINAIFLALGIADVSSLDGLSRRFRTLSANFCVLDS